MVDVGRAHDSKHHGPPTLEELANRQQVPVQMLARVLEALEADGLLRRTGDNIPQYLPGHSIRRISVIDILASARIADDDGRADDIRCDEPVAELLRNLEREVIAVLQDKTLADLIETTEDPEVQGPAAEDSEADENRIV